MRCLFSLVLLWWGASLPAQELLLWGIVRDDATLAPLDSAAISVLKDGLPMVTLTTDTSGRYEVALAYGPVYRVEYARPGRVTKAVVIETGGVPAGDREIGHAMNVDTRLFEPREGADHGFLREPMGIARYDAADANMAWDMDHTARMRELLRAAGYATGGK